MNKIKFSLIAGLIFFSGLVYASPWSCLKGWVNANQDYLNQHNVDFWHQNNGLIEEVAFTAGDSNDPFEYDQPTQLGETIYNNANHCGVIGGFDSKVHYWGNAGHI